MKCTRCPLHSVTRHQFRYWGSKRPQVIYVDLHPRRPDDLIGKSFTGPEYRFLRVLHQEAADLARYATIAYGMAYLLHCHPCEVLGGATRPPLVTELELCADNYQRIIDDMNPEVLIYLGSDVKKYASKRWRGTSVSIAHPFALLRHGSTESAEYRGARSTLEGVFTSLKQKRRHTGV